MASWPGCACGLHLGVTRVGAQAGLDRSRDVPVGRACRPPGPRGLWPAGNLGDYEKDRLAFLAKARDEFGGVVSFDRRTSVVNDPALARSVLQGEGGRYEVTENFLQQRLTQGQVADLLSMRRLLIPGLRRSVVGHVGPQVAGLLDQRLHAMAGAGAFDPTPVMEAVISEAVARHYFGADGPGLCLAVRRLLDALSVVIGNPFALPPGWPGVARVRIGRRHRPLRDAVVDLLTTRDQTPAGRVDAATMALALRDSAEQTVDRVAHLLIGALLASQRVPAAAVSWMLMLLADRPELQRQLRAEAQRFAQSFGPASSRRESRPLLVRDYPLAHAVGLESLRLYPATWLVTRTTTRQSCLGGYDFDTGHQFLVSPYVVHRDERNFEAAEMFRPERWFDPEVKRAVYLPFGHGVHRCPGSELAMVVMVAVLLTLVDGWKVRRLQSTVRADPRTTLLPRGLLLQLSPR